MSGTFTIKYLGEGQLPASKGTLYTVPANTQAIIKTITLVNIDSTDRTVNLYLSSGTSRKIIPSNLSLAAGFSLETDEEYTLSPGDLIEGYSSVGGVIDYTIHGVEES